MTGKRDNLNRTKEKKKKKKKNHFFFEFRCQYDDFVSLCTSQGGMKSYLQLMLSPSMI